jgi:uncharacterized protein (DUF58 family)
MADALPNIGRSDRRDGIHRLLSQREVAQLGRLVVGSRFTVEGQLQGAHRSPLKGFSVEFADYRQYVSGDDLRHLDWRVYGRQERLYIRQYEEECNLRVHLLLDGSHSMGYGSRDVTKYNYAAKLAASLAYVTVHQQDSTGLTLFSDTIQADLAVRSGLQHLRNLANTAADHQPAGETNVARTIHAVAERTRRRALIVVFSDLFDDLPPLKKALAHFRRRRHDVVLYHVLDRAEIDFPFRDLGNFQDLETGQKLITNPRSIRRAYQEAFGEFLREIQRMCAGLDIDYNMVCTDTPSGPLLRRHLERRARMR